MPALPNLTVLTDDAELARRLDFWGAYHRVLSAIAGIALALLLLHEQTWLLRLLVGYLALALALLVVLRATPRHWLSAVRPVWLVADVALVGTLSHLWGVRGSPAPFLFVPIVVAWTLVPQRGLGVAALVLSLSTVSMAIVVERSDGYTSWTHASSSPLLFLVLIGGALGAAHFVVAFTVREMTQHLRALSRLRELGAQREREAAIAVALEEANSAEALGRLAGGIAHDFNNALTVMLGFSSLAKQQVRRDPAQAIEAVHQIELAAEGAANLTRQLLDFATRKPTRPMPVDVRAEIIRCADLMARALGSRSNLTLELCDTPCVVSFDPGGI